jgi:hypothetical protein
MAYLDKDSVIQVMDDVCKRCDHDECYRKSGREYCPVMDVIDGIKDLPVDMTLGIDLASAEYSDKAGVAEIRQELFNSLGVSPKLLISDNTSTSMTIQYRDQIEGGNK